MDELNMLFQFIDTLTRQLETDYSLDHEKLSDLTVCLVDLSPLRLRFSPDTPFILISAENIVRFKELELYNLVAEELKVRQTLPGSAVVLIEGSGAFLEALGKDPYWAVIIDEEDINVIQKHNNPKRAIADLFRSLVPLRFLSPYEPFQSVIGSQFYGRTFEVNQILTRPRDSFAIFGGRKIGKTSLLKEIRRKLVTKLLPKEQIKRVIWYDFWGHKSDEAFYAEIVRHFGEGFPKLIRPDFASYFPRFIEKMKGTYGGPIFFFFDEVDDLILHERETNYQLLGLLKRIAQAGHCQLLMAGFRLLSEELNRHATPLNFMRPLSLSNLNREQTLSMIKDPMSSLSILIDRGVLSEILNNTGGHPHLVQVYGQSLIELLDKSDERKVTLNHLREIKQRGQLYDSLIDSLIENTSDLEFALVISLSDMEEFTLETIDSLLDEHNINLQVRQIRQICRSLENTGIIARRGNSDNYQFSVPLQSALARSVASPEFVWRKAIRQVELNKS